MAFGMDFINNVVLEDIAKKVKITIEDDEKKDVIYGDNIDTKYTPFMEGNTPYVAVDTIKKVIDKEMQDCSQETLLVIDGTTGQNAISQVKAFKQETDVTGLVLTKMDGTAKGGVVLGIVEENKIPVKFIGVGEQMEDMEIFNSEEFVKAII